MMIVNEMERNMGMKSEGCGGVLLPNVTALLLLAGAFLLFNWPNIAVRPAAIRPATPHHSSHEVFMDCSRTCVAGEEPRNCYFKATLQVNISQQTRFGETCESNTSTRCPQRTMLSINGQLPGFHISVCQHDTVVVDVENRMPGLETALHWHGMHQRGSPYMDGVPMITQCPIQAGTVFRYKFQAHNPGTHFYHAHSALQHADGLFGPLIVRQPKQKDVNAELFDWDMEDHVMMIFPWTESIMAYNLNLETAPKISSVLVNGQGLEYGSPAKFSVTADGRYRFRIINAASLDCPIRLQIDKHMLTVIESDGAPVEPITLPYILIYPGERYDVVITTDKQPSLYWIGIQGQHMCEAYNQVAYLQYHEADAVNSSMDLDDFISELMPACSDESQPTQLKLYQKKNMDVTVQKASNAVHRVYQPYGTVLYDGLDDTDLDFGFSFDDVPYYPSYLFNGKGSMAIAQVNHLTFMYPSAPVLSQPDILEENKICRDGSKAKLCEMQKNFCECFHVIYLPINTSADIILIDEGLDSNYSTTFHVHGYSFLFLGSKSMEHPPTVDTIKQMDVSGQLVRNLVNPPRKDTVVVPKNGYAILRLFTNNPGYWLFESQSSSLATGRSLEFVIKVGDQKDVPPIPQHFPRCGIFKGPNFIF